MAHTRRPTVRLLLFAALALTVAAVTTAPASAHSGIAIAVPRLRESRGHPSINGYCEPTYVYGAGATVGYPAAAYPPSRMRILIAGTHLYACIPRIPRSATTSVITMAFDRDHNGTDLPQGDDVLLTVNETGAVTRQQGTGTGWGPWFPTATGANTTIVDADYWSAEFYVNLSELAGAAPLSVDGFQFSTFVNGTEYTWPIGSSMDDPRTWAEVWYGVPQSEPAGIGEPILDMARVTQGLDWDLTGTTTPYQMVWGKDTFAKAQLYTSGVPGRVTESHCQIRKPSGATFDVPAVSDNAGAQPQVNPWPLASFNGNGTFNCWIPGYRLSVAGRYRITLVVNQRDDPVTHEYILDEPYLYPSGPIRLYMQPAVKSLAPDYREWGTDLTAAIEPALANFSRVEPTASALGRVDVSNPGDPSAPGVRFSVAPTIMRCPASTSTWPRCNAAMGAQMLDALRAQNTFAQSQPRAGTIDRYDYVYDMQAATVNPGEGGGDCGYGHDRVATAGQGQAGGAWDGVISGFPESALVHEVTHCLGAVRTTSPHSDTGGHSNTPSITPYLGWRLVHMIFRETEPTAGSQMTPAVGGSTNIFLEGWEWNDTHNTLVSMPRPARPVVSPARGTMDGSASGAPVGVKGSKGPYFQVSGIVDGSTGDVTVIHSERVAESVPTTPAVSGQYSLEFRDTNGDPLTTVPFDALVRDTHGNYDSDPYFSLSVPLPAGAAKTRIMEGATQRWLQVFSPSAPVVTGVTVVPAGGGGSDVSWSGSDTDGDTPVYQVYFEKGPGKPPALLTTGLAATSIHFDDDLAPATSAALITVVGTDGYNTGTADSAPFTVDAKPPTVAISHPTDGATLVAGTRITFTGGGFDLNAGILGGSRLRWRSDLDGRLGTGAALWTSLSPGTHVITLKATAPSGLTADDSITVTVLKDSDGDGLPNSWELPNLCMKVSKKDAIADPDVDRLASGAERLWGTDPCTSDTDGDGWSDGDEVALGSDALAVGSVPPPPDFYLPGGPVDLGSCPAPKVGALPLEATSPSVDWTAGSNSDWLSVTSSGTGSATVSLTADCKGLGKGKHTAQVMVASTSGRPVRLSVTVHG